MKSWPRGARLAASSVFVKEGPRRLDPERYVEMARRSAPLVDRAFVERALERIRRLWGQWRGTPFHETMLLDWPARDTDRGRPPG